MADPVIQKFEALCAELEATSSRTQKSHLMVNALKDDSDLQTLFLLAVDPTIQFYQIFDEVDQLAEINFVDFTAYAKQLSQRLPFDQKAGSLGKWLARVLNKSLRIGVGQAMISKLCPGAKFEVETMEGDYVHKQEWFELVHHLEDSRNWVIIPEPEGIKCNIQVFGGKIFPIIPTGLPLANFQHLEKEIVAMDGGRCWRYEGRLVAPAAKTLEDTYEYFLDPDTAPEHLEDSFFWVQDLVDFDLTLKERLELLFQLTPSRCGVRRPIPEIADFRTTDQLEESKRGKFAKVSLRYLQGLYKFGKTRDMIYIKL